MDTKTKRAAALGYGLSFLLVLPVAEGSISIESAGHALSAYSYDMPAPAAQNQLAVRITAEAVLSSGMMDQSMSASELNVEAATYAYMATETVG